MYEPAGVTILSFQFPPLSMSRASLLNGRLHRANLDVPADCMIQFSSKNGTCIELRLIVIHIYQLAQSVSLVVPVTDEQWSHMRDLRTWIVGRITKGRLRTRKLLADIGLEHGIRQDRLEVAAFDVAQAPVSMEVVCSW